MKKSYMMRSNPKGVGFRAKALNARSRSPLSSEGPTQTHPEPFSAGSGPVSFMRNRLASKILGSGFVLVM